jgi:hypothetical protein
LTVLDLSALAAVPIVPFELELEPELELEQSAG